jgi:hypothetical protein
MILALDMMSHLGFDLPALRVIFQLSELAKHLLVAGLSLHRRLVFFLPVCPHRTSPTEKKSAVSSLTAQEVTFVRQAHLVADAHNDGS